MYSKQVVADQFIAQLIESQGIWQNGNRSYDSLCQPGATSVQRFKVGKIVIMKNAAGDDGTGAGRKKAKEDTTPVVSILDTYTARIKAEVAQLFESNDRLRMALLEQTSPRMSEQFDADFIAAMQATTNKLITKASGVCSWEDVTSLLAYATNMKIPQSGRVVVFSAALQSDFLNMDVIKNAIAFNQGLLTGGQFSQFMGTKFYVSANAPLVDGKANVSLAWGLGVASIINRQGVIKEVYSSTLQADIIDIFAHAKFELDDNDFAVCMKLK